jgi:Protein of unknown function (DUF669)
MKASTLNEERKMAQLPSAFNANDHEAQRDFSAMPPGQYTAVITASEKKEARNAGNFYWKLEFTIIEGEFKGRKVWANLNLINSNPKAVEIANSELSSICKAVGKVAITDTAELHDIPMQITLKVTPATAQYSESNSVSGYKQLAGLAVPPAPAAAAAAAEVKRKPWD